MAKIVDFNKSLVAKTSTCAAPTDEQKKVNSKTRSCESPTKYFRFLIFCFCFRFWLSFHFKSILSVTFYFLLIAYDHIHFVGWSSFPRPWQRSLTNGSGPERRRACPRETTRKLSTRFSSRCLRYFMYVHARGVCNQPNMTLFMTNSSTLVTTACWTTGRTGRNS